MELFITCAKGIEPLLVQELRQLGIQDCTEGYRGVNVYQASMSDVYAINYLSRLGGRVLLLISRGRCRDARALYRGAMQIDWLRYIPKNKTFAIDANVTHPEIRNSLFAAQVVKDAICDQFRERTGERPSVSVQDPDVQLNLFIHNESASISIDTSGQSLHKRGYRQETVEAPMQETLAAAILTLAKYKGDEIVYDPCCGSGTLLIEAAMIATHTPPGFLRVRWGFQNLQDHSQEQWLRIKADADSKRVPLPKGRIFGTDVNKKAATSSKINARAAGFHQSIEIVNCDFRDFEPSVPPNFVVTNPPHGIRLDHVEQLFPLYRSLGDWMKRRTAKPARGFILVGSPELAKEVGLAASRRHVLDNGGVDSRLLEFDLY